MADQLNFTPRELVSELDRYIIGQDKAKKAVAIALRNRWRRQQVADDLRDEIMPKNIIMIGPTGVGKTEIARRLAKLARAPFIKVEASKFTEVGYVGRDVESMIRDITEVAVKLIREEAMEDNKIRAQDMAEDRLLDLLLPKPKNRTEEEDASYEATREKLRKKLRAGDLDDRDIELDVQDKTMPMFEIFSSAGMEEMDINIKDMFGNFLPKRTKKRRVTIAEARELLMVEEGAKLVDMDKVQKTAVKRVEQSGIIFLDEIDKVAGREASRGGPDVSREGVQRDLLPIIEGSAVNTKYGIVKTDHILFIAAGAFNVSKPSDLVPELQGRFPIRVELDSLTKDDFVRILTEPKNALTKQYEAMMATEGVTVNYLAEGIAKLAELATNLNDRMENIGARRLHTVMEKLLEEVSFKAPEIAGTTVTVNAEYVEDHLTDVVKDDDLSKYIL